MNAIKVIFYSSQINTSGDRLLRAVEMLFTKEQIEIFRTLDSFKYRLHNPLTEPVIFVILTASNEELNDLSILQSALQDRRLILVLPDENPESIAKGHAFRPRFLTYADGDFAEILGVLGKMAGMFSPKGHHHKGPYLH